jgi:hypothetical protein
MPLPQPLQECRLFSRFLLSQNVPIAAQGPMLRLAPPPLPLVPEPPTVSKLAQLLGKGLLSLTVITHGAMRLHSSVFRLTQLPNDYKILRRFKVSCKWIPTDVWKDLPLTIIGGRCLPDS